MPEDEPKTTDEKPKRESGPSPLSVWGSLIGLFAVCKVVEIEDKALATEIFKYGLVVWVVGLVLSFIVGRSARETKNNAIGCGYIILMGIALIVVGVAVGGLLPSSCTGSASDWQYYRK